MSTLDKSDIRLFNMSFNVYNQKSHYLELTSKSGQFWCVYKEDEELVLLLHKHHSGDKYHVHYIFNNTSSALSEIMQHERYIEKRRKLHKKLCGNRKIEILL
jgi:hypothetical protein